MCRPFTTTGMNKIHRDPPDNWQSSCSGGFCESVWDNDGFEALRGIGGIEDI